MKASSKYPQTRFFLFSYKIASIEGSMAGAMGHRIRKKTSMDKVRQ